MRELRNHLVCKNGHYVWLGQPEDFMRDSEAREGAQRVYFCPNCHYEDAPVGVGLYTINELKTASQYDKEHPVRDQVIPSQTGKPQTEPER